MSNIAAMITAVDVNERLEQIDQQIMRLLDERIRICEGLEFDSEEEADMESLWMELAEEHGLDEVKMEKMAKIVISLCRTHD